MKKTALKVVERQNGGYTLTKGEFASLCIDFYQARSCARILEKITHPEVKEQENISDMDIYNLSGMLSEKLKTIEPLLGK